MSQINAEMQIPPIPERGEFSTFYPIIEWNISQQTKELLQQSQATFLLVGNMPDDRERKVKRYDDSNPDNVDAQKVAIHTTLDTWFTDLVAQQDLQGPITVALCSGSRGIDLEAYRWVLEKRKENPEKEISVISILPLRKKDFRAVSVLGSSQEDMWDALFQQLISDDHAIVHQPHFKPLYGVDRFLPVTSKSAVRRSKLVNGNSHEYVNFSDTQRQLMELASLTPNRRNVRMLVATDGGEANGEGGTNEMVARFFHVFKNTIADNQTAGEPTVYVTQAGFTMGNTSRELAVPLESNQAKNSEYRDAIGKQYAPTFAFEDNIGSRGRGITVFRRTIQRASRRLT